MKMMVEEVEWEEWLGETLFLFLLRESIRAEKGIKVY